jgi:hypothetical protein
LFNESSVTKNSFNAITAVLMDGRRRKEAEMARSDFFYLREGVRTR